MGGVGEAGGGELEDLCSDRDLVEIWTYARWRSQGDLILFVGSRAVQGPCRLAFGFVQHGGHGRLQSTENRCRNHRTGAHHMGMRT
mmetsp:Transcript_10660/g.27330  ORF Transcript_10660/g.27330 Transcript_10660/m.27330 type:complete len:86 (+) Transcript_10660:334-591(+)